MICTLSFEVLPLWRSGGVGVDGSLTGLYFFFVAILALGWDVRKNIAGDYYVSDLGLWCRDFPIAWLGGLSRDGWISMRWLALQIDAENSDRPSMNILKMCLYALMARHCKMRR